MTPMFWNRFGKVGDDRFLTVAALTVAALVECGLT